MEEGRMSVDSDEGDMIINEIDGLPNLHPNYNDFEFNQQTHHNESRTIDDIIHDEDLPTSIIATNIDSSVFKNEEFKVKNWNFFANELAYIDDILFCHLHLYYGFI